MLDDNGGIKEDGKIQGEGLGEEKLVISHVNFMFQNKKLTCSSCDTNGANGQLLSGKVSVLSLNYLE